MALREDFEAFGLWLFRWRSYLPLAMFGLVLFALRHFTYPMDSHALDREWELVCCVVSLLGIVVRVGTIGCAPKGTSGRNLKSQVADTLNTTGMYSIVRHPLYVGNFLIGLGIALFPRLWTLGLLYIFAFWLYYERIMFAEEEFLRRKFGDAYLEWAERTATFFPNPVRWRRPSVPFSLRWVLKREHSTVFAVVATYTFLDIVGDFFATKQLLFDGVWVVLFCLTGVGYVVLRILSKKTTLLDIEGR